MIITRKNGELKEGFSIEVIVVDIGAEALLHRYLGTGGQLMVLSGSGVITDGRHVHRLSKADSAFIPEMTSLSIRNTSSRYKLDLLMILYLRRTIRRKESSYRS